MAPLIGVLALQGDYREHTNMLHDLGCQVREVRLPSDLEHIDGVVIPGGESTTIGKLADRFGLLEPLRSLIDGGLPAYGSCAGLIFCASGLTEGDQPMLGVLDVIVRRNAFGRQNESFEAEVSIAGLAAPFPGVFIRAPWVAKVGSGVEVLATVDDHPVMVRQDHVLATAFHPELTSDRRVHQMFVDSIRTAAPPETGRRAERTGR